MKTLNDAFIKQVIQELKVKYGDFAIVVRGWTPDFMDGDICEHNYDYSICNGTYESSNGYKYFHNDELYVDEQTRNY